MKPFSLHIFLFFSTLLNITAQKVKPYLNLPVGFRYNMEMVASMSVEQEYIGIRYNTKMDIGTLLTFKVMSVDADTNYVLSSNFEKIDIQVESPLINMEVSSESAATGDSLSIVLRSLLGKDFRLMLNSRNEITLISGLNKMINETISSSSLPGEQKTDLIMNLLQSIGEEALQDNLQGMGNFYPASPVKSSDRWETTSSLTKNGIPMELSSRILVKTMNKNQSVMISEGSIRSQLTPADSCNTSSTAQITRVSGNLISEIKMDMRTGLIVESISSENISGSIKSADDKDDAKNILIPFAFVIRNSIHIYPVK